MFYIIIDYNLKKKIIVYSSSGYKVHLCVWEGEGERKFFFAYQINFKGKI